MNLQDLKWGSFGVVHFISLMCAVAMCVGIYFLLKNRSERTQTIVLFILSLFGMASVLYDFFYWGSTSSYLIYLPLHLCSYNQLLMPVLVLSKNRMLGNLLPLFAVGAGIALIFNSIQADYAIFSWVFWLYYLSHTFGAAIPFLMYALKLVKPGTKYILPAVGITMLLYTVAHVFNLIINDYFIVNDIRDYLGEVYSVNYMFSIHPQGNPLLSFFYSIIPYPYFYMLMAVPIATAYFALINIKEIIASIKSRIGKKKEAE
ncbi:MAG: YwaF family protein [Clostridia bacterium]|nr:YwaF family protein [Clostridia bacterium]